MKHTLSVSLPALLTLPVSSRGQATSNLLPDAPSHTIGDTAGTQSDSTSSPVAVDHSPIHPAPAFSARLSAAEKFHYYMSEAFLNPAAITAPAFRAGLRIANPPGREASTAG